MNFSEVLNKISDFFTSLKDKVIQFYNENKKLALIIGILVVVILLCLILLICMVSGPKKEKSEPTQPPLVLTETLQIPNGPEMPDDYNFSRKTKSQWSEEETEPWFTIPSEKEIHSLSQTNNTMINELLEAAP